MNIAYTIFIATKRQQLAYKGDVDAAKRIVLPCYKPLLRVLLICYILFTISFGLSLLSISEVNNEEHENNIVQYYLFSFTTVYSIIPVLLTQNSVSVAGFWRGFYIILPWWLISTILWGLHFAQPIGESRLIFEILFIIITAFIPFLFALAVLLKLTYSRIQLGSSSNRNATELLLVYSFIVGIVETIEIADYYYNKLDSYKIETFLSVVSLISNIIFPFLLYRTLLADTKFWRGLGRHNQSGLKHDESISAGDVHRPTIDLQTASFSFQDMMSDIGDITIDFAFLQLDKLIGEGSSAKVYSGKFKRKLVAIKLSTPAEITEESINVFVAEAKVASTLSHVNIVNFIGLCIRPPQIAMVLELCEGGDLKSNLIKYGPTRWSAIARLKACLDCTRAVHFLHSIGYIHRDIKAENFFVNRKGIVKLGDFGESTLIPNKATVAGNHENVRRMTILGTVSFMAPELIKGTKVYDESIDIYALGITFWEIWTHGKDPYENISQFQIYEKVSEGYRPKIESDWPIEFVEIMTSAWQHDVKNRPNSSELCSFVEKLVRNGNVSHNSNDNNNNDDNNKDMEYNKVDKSTRKSNNFMNVAFNVVTNVMKKTSISIITKRNDDSNSSNDDNENNTNDEVNNNPILHAT
eukprot:gene14362-19264_t